MDYLKHVPGEKRRNVMVYALSTCIWCRKAKNLLADLGVEYDYVDVDLQSGETLDEIKAQLDHWNPQGSFPTIVINNEKCILGFDEDSIVEELGHG